MQADELKISVGVMNGAVGSNPLSDANGYFECDQKEVKHYEATMLEFPCSIPVFGRYVYLELNWVTYSLYVHEIEVYSGPLANSALEKVTLQSTISNGIKKPEFAVDGVVDGTCSVTAENGADPWWSVDIRGHYRVAEVHFLGGPS
ncbi:hypothetical protein LSAT2_013726, partial [Lamellibrachia satsuma]